MVQLRLAVTGQTVGASLPETCAMLGRAEVLARLQAAVAHLQRQ